MGGDRSASREHSGSTSSTALTPPVEERLIILAQGLQYLNHQLPATYRVPEYLQSRLGGDVEVRADGTAVYTSRAQGVRFVIRKITRKNDFKDALQTRGAHDIDGGHARYGRGPCFGESASPGDDWEVGTNPSVNGIFRWGYPYMGIDVHEIIDHGYHCYALLVTDPKPPREDFHPELRRVYGRDATIRPSDALKPYRLDQFHPDLAARILGTTPPPGPARPIQAGDRLWGSSPDRHGRPAKIVLHGNWTGSMSDPLDLGATDMTCKVFCHFGCSSFHHNYRPLRFLKGWQRTEDDRFAYWTTAPPPHVNLPSRWIYFLLRYPRRNAFQNWHPSLIWTLNQTNQHIVNTGGGYRVI